MQDDIVHQGKDIKEIPRTFTKSGAIMQSNSKKKIVLINPQHSYGGKLIYLNGSLTAIAAMLMAMGHAVTVIDLNIDHLKDEVVELALKAAEFIGITLTGAPYIPETLVLIPYLRSVNAVAPILLGGQVIEKLSDEELSRIYGKLPNTVPIRSNGDLAAILGWKGSVPSPYRLPFHPVWQAMGVERLVLYARYEMTLVTSQGCSFNCAFCAARKDEAETHRTSSHFKNDLLYLAEVAQHAGIPELRFYASSLDFFQNLTEVETQLKVLAEVQEETGIRMRVRCLSCLTSFTRAAKRIPQFGELLQKAGLWCVGFGSDGTSKNVWQAQNKPHNTLTKLEECIRLSHQFGIRAELLMVLGFPEENWRTLLKTVGTSLWSTVRWSHVIIRPYLAKPFVPGNEGWTKNVAATRSVTSDPTLFYNLDFAALGSQLTHPRFGHRLASNTTYLALCALTLIGKGSTSPLLPQGGKGSFSAIARLVNRTMPFDR